MQSFSNRKRLEKKSIGFVPTMGFLHAGHVSLIKKSKKKSDISVVSIFVNPAQFSPNEDLKSYPRDFERDIKILKNNKVDALFFPGVQEIYHDDFQTFIEVTKLSRNFEGEFRPEHFKGVTTIVNILINSVKPDYIFFGQKDAQQAAVISQMIKDIKSDVKLIVCPIIREKDGLALSSRNIYLSDEERKDALSLSRSLKYAEELISNGERESDKITSQIIQILKKVKNLKLDYVSIVNSETFEAEKNLKKNNKYYILIACRIGKTRLIDNSLIKL